jgi:hypothetical protein
MTALDQSWLALAEVWVDVVRNRRVDMRKPYSPQRELPPVGELKNHKVSIDRVLTIGRRAWRKQTNRN